jgi:hypothetical protein
MKLGAIYTVFNGIELLKKSIEQIYNDVDVIVIVYQETSNRGFADGNVRHKISLVLEELKNAQKINFIPFIPNLGIDTKTNELNKHNLGLQFLKQQDCTHFFLSAVDHFYITDEFRYAKKRTEWEGHDVTLTSMFTYYKNVTWQIDPIESYYMPFICKLHRQTQYVKKKWSLLVDPSVRINTDSSMYLFKEEEIMMHHYSMIRDDIENKFNNAAASSRWGDKAKIYLDEYLNATIESKLAYFGGRGLKVVPNYFGI